MLARLSSLLVLVACTTPTGRAGTTPIAATGAAAPAPPAPPVVHRVLSRGDRAWVVLDTPPPADAVWTVLEPMTFDNTSTAPAPRLAQPRAVTLVGSEGSCEIASAEQVFVSPGLTADRFASAALVIDLDACSIGDIGFALDAGAGPARGQLRGGAQDTSPPGVAAWVERVTGVALTKDFERVDASAVYREWVPGTDVEALYAFLDIATPTMSATEDLLLRRGEHLIARLGRADLLGSLHWRDRDYAIVVDGAATRAIDVTR